MKNDFECMGLIYEQAILNEGFRELLGSLRNKLKLNTFINLLDKLDPDLCAQLTRELFPMIALLSSITTGFAFNKYLKDHPESTFNNAPEHIQNWLNKHPETQNKIIDVLNKMFNKGY